MFLKEATVVYTAKRIPGRRPTISSMRDVALVMRDRVLSATREHFWVLYLNAKHEMIAIECIAVGHLNGVDVHPREVFRGAMLAGARAVILAHNHPSGDCAPSSEDFAVTRRMKEVGELVGIPVLDHIVLGDERFASIKNEVEYNEY